MIHLTSQLYVQWHHVGSLQSSVLGAFTPWKMVNTTNQGLVYCFIDFLDLDDRENANRVKIVSYL